MAVIDEEGRLFGRVNVIDALVVLLALAVVVAGLALVVGGGDEPAPPAEERPQTITRNATLALGPLPADRAGLVEPGTVSVGNRTLTIRDVYRTPRADGRVAVLAAVTARANETDRGAAFAGKPLRYGTSYTLETPTYALGASVYGVGGAAAIETERVRTTVRANVSAAVADAIAAGDVQTIDGTDVARVRSVERLSGSEDRTTVRVRLSVRARPLSDAYYYGGAPLRIGNRLRFATDRYRFAGEVTNVATA